MVRAATATPGGTLSNQQPTSTSASVAPQSSGSGKSDTFGKLNLDEVIALAVGIPSVLLAAVGVWYAWKNDWWQQQQAGNGHESRHLTPQQHWPQQGHWPQRGNYY